MAPGGDETPAPLASSYRWWVLVSMCVTLGVQSGVRLTFAVFYVALRHEFGFGMVNLVSLGGRIGVGWLIDAIGVDYRRRQATEGTQSATAPWAPD